MSDAPPRLLDQADSPLRDLLQAGRAEWPDDAQLTRLSQNTAAALAGGGALAKGAAVGAKLGLSAKLGLLALAMAATVATVTAFRHAPSKVKTVAPSKVQVVQAPVVPGPSTAPELTPPVTPSVAPPPPRVVPSASAPTETEMQMLSRAQAAVHTNPAAALAACTEHARAYPHGTFEQEREVLAIDALVQLGRTHEALARANKFAAAHPGSSHQRRIDTILADVEQ